MGDIVLDFSLQVDPEATSAESEIRLLLSHEQTQPQGST